MNYPADNGSGINRRQFLVLTAAAVVTGCQTSGGGGNPTAAQGDHVVNAGPVSRYATDGLYSHFRDQGFFVIRQGDQLFALSSYCTHRKCKLDAKRDHSFYCPCHGSTFTSAGKVTEGPAKRDLPMLPTVTDDHGQLLVTVPSL